MFPDKQYLTGKMMGHIVKDTKPKPTLYIRLLQSDLPTTRMDMSTYSTYFNLPKVDFQLQRTLAFFIILNMEKYHEK